MIDSSMPRKQGMFAIMFAIMLENSQEEEKLWREMDSILILRQKIFQLIYTRCHMASLHKAYQSVNECSFSTYCIPQSHQLHGTGRNIQLSSLQSSSA